MSNKVTVGIPTYNRKDYLRQALESVVAQSYDNLEIIVSDNHSVDGTEQMMREYMVMHPEVDIKYFRMEKNIGPVKNWENCHQQATGQYLLILSDDDVLEENAVANMAMAFEQDVVQVIGNVIFIDADGNEIRRKENLPGIYDSYSFWDARLNKGLHDTPSAVMYRRELGSKAFYEILGAGTAGDMAMSFVLGEQGYIKCINSYVVRYRIHEGNDTLNFYRCASSHVGLYQLFKSRGVSPDKMAWLQRYCRDVIVWYANQARLQYKFRVMMQILCLLDNKLDLNIVSALQKTVIRFVCSKLRKLVG